MKHVTIGTKIVVKNVSGTTTRKGAKQNKTYTITSERDKYNHFDAVDEKGKEFYIYDPNQDFRNLGIRVKANWRITYTADFEIVNS